MGEESGRREEGLLVDTCRDMVLESVMSARNVSNPSGAGVEMDICTCSEVDNGRSALGNTRVPSGTLGSGTTLSRAKT